MSYNPSLLSTHFENEREISQLLRKISHTRYPTCVKFLKQWFWLRSQEKLVALGSDGANVMVGKKTGVAKRLQDQIPHLISNHCVAHRLALASAQAADEVAYLKRFKSVISQLFHFYHASPVRTAGLTEMQEILGQDQLRIKAAKDVRWLSYSHAIAVLRKSFQAALLS